MAFEQDAADSIDLRGSYKPFRHGRMQFRLPGHSHRKWVESLLLIAVGLVGGFGLGLAFAMFRIVS